MEENFKKARLITIAMMGSVLAMGIVAFMLSERHGYGGSSEAKINFLRLVLFVFSITQIVMAGVIRKTMTKMSSLNPRKILTGQIVAGALCESVAVFGLVLVVVSKSLMDYFIFGVIALAGLLIFFPKRTKNEGKRT